MQEKNTMLRNIIHYATADLERLNVLSNDHARLVEAIAKTLVDYAHGELRGRYAVEAPVGSGKTTLVRALIRALAEDPDNEVGVIVLQERVSSGAEMLNDLLAVGIDREKLALVHAKQHIDKDLPSVAQDREFVFATHRRATMASIIPLLTYQGRPRVVIIDEALYSSHAVGESLSELKPAIAWARSYFGKAGHDPADNVVEWLDAFEAEMTRAATKFKKDNREGVPVLLPAGTSKELKSVAYRLKRPKDSPA